MASFQCLYVGPELRQLSATCPSSCELEFLFLFFSDMKISMSLISDGSTLTDRE